MRNRVVILVVALAVIVGMLACSASTLVSRNEPTATPTKTPKPTFTVTLTPTDTPIPTDTPLPTPTWTPTPEVTNTPIVYTATPTDTPLPTETPTSPPPTNTPKPQPKPTKKPTARPTNPPQPTTPPQPTYAFQGTITGGTPNCGTTGIKGKIKTRTGAAYPGVTVAVWADGWEGRVSNPADNAGNWDMFLNQGAMPGNWHAAVVKADTCLKNSDGALIGNSCERQSNVVDLATTAHCSGDGAVQWPEVQFQQN